jgi:hypothetical protein
MNRSTASLSVGDVEVDVVDDLPDPPEIEPLAAFVERVQDSAEGQS